MLTLAVQVSFLLAIVTASKLSLPLQARLDDCPPYLQTGWSERVCGDICLPVGQFCCGNIPSSPLLYACPIGTVCNNPNIGNNNYLGRCCEGRNNPPIGAIDNCQEVPQFPSTSYIPGTVTAPNPSPSSTACGAEAIAEGYGYRDCGDICLDVGHICCGFIQGTNQAWSCEVGQTCLYPGSANIDPGSCVYASGYIVPGKIFVASNTTVTSSRPSTTSTRTISSSTPTTTSSSGLTTSSTGGSSESASITAQSSSSSTTSQLPISTASRVATGSSSLGTVTSSPSSPAFTGAATRHSPIENSVIYALGGLIVVLI